MNARKILIVDFDEDYINSLKNLLQPEGFQISIAADSLSGLEKFKAEKPDLVILESLLPKLGAFELCNKLFKENKRKVPVIMLTGAYIRAKDKKGNNNLVRAIPQNLKPYKQEELLKIISDLLRQKGTPKSNGGSPKPASLFRILLKGEPVLNDKKPPLDVSHTESDKDLLPPLRSKPVAQKEEQKIKKEDAVVEKKSEKAKDEIDRKLEEVLAEFGLELDKVSTSEKTDKKKKKVNGLYKLIVADDSPVVQKVVKLAFSKEDFEIHALSNGKEVVDSIEQINPDILLLDINLPKRNGREICRFIQDSDKLNRTPVIFLKEAFEKIDREMIKKLDYDDIIQKPFDSGKLVIKVKKILDKNTSP